VETSPTALWFLEQEARALLTRLARVKSFALYETMVPAAAVSNEAQRGIERFITVGRRHLHDQVRDFLRWLRSPEALRLGPAEAQRRFSLLRLRFVTMLDQFDIFADALTQRSENETGVWLSGLDEVAADALRLPGGYYELPPVVCYLDRGHGAAIRRARTRLPGGGPSPVALIRIPRERMIGSGIASSLVHEVGHQGATLLNLIESLRPLLHGLQLSGGGRERFVWTCWERWIAEIVSDLWAVARLGITATVGLIGVVSLPRYFVFRLTLSDPHPPPWLRVLLSCAMGEALYPDGQWSALARIWKSFFPTASLPEAQRIAFALLESSIPGFVALLINHRPASLRGRPLAEVLAAPELRPGKLRAAFRALGGDPARLRAVAPARVFAMIGQARADGVLTPEAESRLLGFVLTDQALRSTLARSEACIVPSVTTGQEMFAGMAISSA
jgi:hypothetical protein